MALTTSSPHKAEALKVMEYFSTQELGMALAEHVAALPVNIAALESLAVKNNADVSAFAQQVKVAVPMPTLPEMAPMWTAMREALIKAVVVDGNIAQVLKDTQEAAVRDIKNMR